MKSETRRRSSRQQAMNQDFPNQSPESDISSKDGEKEEYTMKNDDSLKEEHDEGEYRLTNEMNIYDKSFPIDKRLETKRFNHQEGSSRDDSVKKWIEDSNKVIKVNIIETLELSYSSSGKSLTPEGKIIKKETVKDEIIQVDQTSIDKKNNNTETEKDRTAETHALNDFCSIVEHAPKLETPTETIETPTKLADSSPSKECDKLRKKKLVESRHKRKRNHSVGFEDSIKSPTKEKREKRAPVLEYKIDFMSDLGKFPKY